MIAFETLLDFASWAEGMSFVEVEAEPVALAVDMAGMAPGTGLDIPHPQLGRVS